ncbi:carboxypeptidase regulatory-like domain-containing protein [Candidatus Micrarchaeota archaeon]|nr:carboxypeptidase regulatory-like domain-containing protein [Candidatus Micrarchaeota archaeon]
MGVKEFYHSIEDKYYALMDSLDKRGIPVYKAIDFLESKNIPSFPVFILSIIILIALIYFAFTLSGVISPMNEFTLSVGDESGNALTGARVTLTYDEETSTKTTNDDGKAVFSVPAGKNFSVIVRKEGYAEKAKEFSAVDKSGMLSLALLPLNRIEIMLYKEGTTQLIDETVTVSFYCSEGDYLEERTTSTGRITLEGVPSDCGRLIADVVGGDCIEGCSIDSSKDTASIYLSGKEDEEKGELNVEVVNESGDALTGIHVNLIPFNGSISAETSCVTYGSGSCTMDNIPFGDYYVTAYDPNEGYSFYNSSVEGEIISINPSNPVKYFEITMKKDVLGQINVIVIDASTGEGVENAEVKLLRDNLKQETKKTNEEGVAVFNVGTTQEVFSLAVNHPDYLIADSITGVGARDEAFEFRLTQATANNSQRIDVEVLDSENEPVENVKVFLKKADEPEVIIGKEMLTGMDGRTSFGNVEEGRYIVYAEKNGFPGKNSEPITVRARTPAKIVIHLEIGRGTIDLRVVNEEKQAIQGATARVIDLFSNKEMSELKSVTDSSGNAGINVRADKVVYLKVSAPNYADFTSVPIKMYEGSIPKEIVLVEGITELDIVLQGFYSKSEQAEDSGEGIKLSKGNEYVAKFLLLVPETDAVETGVHIRTGAEKDKVNNIMEKDDLFIEKIYASNAMLIRGTSFNPPNGFEVDSQHLTSGDSKWANIVFNEPVKGAIEIEARIQLKEITSSSLMNLAYRAWIVTGEGVLREPFDAELKEAESTPTKHSLYAKAKYKPLMTGASSMCTDYFCYSLNITDLSSGMKTMIADEFPAEINNDYRMEFSLINVTEKDFDNVELEIKNELKGLQLKNYSIEGSQGIGKEGKIVVPVGSVSEGTMINGMIEFNAKKEGPNKLELSLVSSSEEMGKENVFQKTIKIDTKAQGEMKIDLLPKILVPFINNNLLIRISDTDENPLSEVLVEVRKDGENVVNGFTDGEGVFAVTLEEMGPRTKVKIVAEKRGYREVELEVEVQKEILLVNPTEINETFIVSKEFTVKREIIARNITEIPLNIVAVEVSDAFNGMVQFTWEEDYSGKELVAVEDNKLYLTIGLTPKGKMAEETTLLEGTINIVVENEEIEKQWVSSIPVSITIGLGGEVDEADCLIIEPEEWRIRTDGTRGARNFTLKNICTVEGKPVSLRNLEARILWEGDNEVAGFELTPKMAEGNKIELTNKWKIAVPLVKPTLEDEGEVIEFSFTPDEINSASSKMRIQLKATHLTETGKQAIQTEVNTEIQISKLIECIEVIERGPLTIQLGAFSQGYGMFQGQFGNTGSPFGQYPNYYNQSQNYYPYGYGGQYYQGSTYGSYPYSSDVMYPSTNEWMNRSWPSAYYNQPYVDNSMINPGSMNQWQPGTESKTSFIVQNNCQSDVEISIEPDPNLSSSDTSFELEPGNEKTVEVMSTYFPGSYPVYVRAKLKDSQQKKTDIKQVNVLVENESQKNYRDCIYLDKRTFQFNDFIQKPVTGKIINSCYGMGVVLDYQSLSLGDYQADYYGNSYRDQSTVDMTKNAEYQPGLINDFRILELINKPGPNGKVIQELRFEIIKEIESSYRSDIPKLPDAKDPITEIGLWRLKLTGAYYTVRAPEILVVNFYNRYGQRQSIPFDIIIEDLWAAVPLVAGEVEWGSEKEIFQECINSESLNVSNYRIGKTMNECLKEDEDFFEKGGTQYLHSNEGKDRVLQIGENLCGQVDSLSLEVNSVAKEEWNGIKLLFSLYDSKHNVQMYVDKSNWDGTETKIDYKLPARLTRMIHGYSQRVYIPVKVCIAGEKKPEGLTDKELECYKELRRLEKDIEELKKEIERLKECVGLEKGSKEKIIEEIDKSYTTEEVKCETGTT